MLGLVFTMLAMACFLLAIFFFSVALTVTRWVMRGSPMVDGPIEPVSVFTGEYRFDPLGQTRFLLVSIPFRVERCYDTGWRRTEQPDFLAAR